MAANLMRWRGELDEAHAILSDSVGDNKNDPRLLLALLDLNKSDDDLLLDTAKSYVEDTSFPKSVRRGLSFVIARRADKSGQYDEAWHYALTANSLYDDGAETPTHQYRRELDMGLKMFAGVNGQKPNNDAEHIYIIGPPRSGGSLLQTIMAAAPGLVSVGERGALMAWFLPILDKAGSLEQALSEWNRIAPDLQKADTAGIVRSHGQHGDRIFIDKMPHHAHVAGLLAKVHPNSKFVDVRRDPLDMATSILFHDFTDKFGYSRSITDIADYLDFQRSAVGSWQTAGLDIQIHDHNAFLEAPEASGAKLFETLDMKWDASYLDPKNRTSTVRTFSALQVRSKVTKSYSGRGEHYREFMGAAADILDQLKPTD
jgi:hypothetical protein